VLKRPSLAQEAFRNLRKGLASRNRRVVLAALNSVYWCARNLKPSDIPDFVSAEVTTLCLSGGDMELHNALDSARLLVEVGAVALLQRERMIDALDIISGVYRYTAVDEPQQQADIGLIRAAAVRLAKALMATGMDHKVLQDLVGLAPVDPLPEVRFAVSEAADD
jgi:hypothetical protein